MNIFLILIKAFLLGVIVTAPVGPVGALVIRRSLKKGFWLGVFTGLGAAFADSSFAWIAVLGIHQIDTVLNRYQSPISLVGGCVLLVIGVASFQKTLKQKKQYESLSPKGTQKLDRLMLQEKSLWNYFFAFLGSALITYSNPATILGFVGSFAAFGFWGYGVNKEQLELLIVGGVFTGAMTWWTSLASIFYRVRHRVSNRTVYKIQIVTNGIIIFSAVYCLMRGMIFRN